MPVTKALGGDVGKNKSCKQVGPYIYFEFLSEILSLVSYVIPELGCRDLNLCLTLSLTMMKIYA
jgi:hypothetical protein